MSVSIEKFFPYVLEDMPGVPDPSLRRALMSACIEFTNDSLLIQQNLDKITAIPGTPDYELALPDGYGLVQIMGAWYDGSRLIPVSADYLDGQDQDWQSKTSENPTHIVSLVDSVITVFPTPTVKKTNVLKVRAALTYSRDSDTVDDVLYEDYVDAIAAGAKAILCMSPNKSYSMPALAPEYKRKFIAGKNAAKLLAQRGKTKAELRVEIPKI